MIQNVTHLLRARRFLPLFATQFLGAFNDSLFKQAVVLFVTYQLYSNPAKEFQFSAIAQTAASISGMSASMIPAPPTIMIPISASLMIRISRDLSWSSAS